MIHKHPPSGTGTPFTRYRRFWKTPHRPWPPLEQRGILRAIGRFLDRKLTISPPHKDNGLKNVIQLPPEEIATEQDKAYALAWREFADAPEGTVEAWLARKRLQTTWSDSDDYRKARRNSVLASFISILVTHTGLYPTKIAGLGVEFPPLSRPAFLAFLLAATWYLTASMNIYLRHYLIEDALLAIEHATQGKLQEFTNRWSRFIEAMYVEKALFDRRIPNTLCLYATLSLLYCVVKYFLTAHTS